MEKVITRLANVSQEEALAELTAAYPDAKTEFPFEKGTEDGQEVYKARVITAEFPPKSDDDNGGSDEGDSKPKSDSSDSDSSDSGDKPKSKSDSKGNSGIEAKLDKIMVALGIPADDGMGEEDPLNGDVPPPSNLDLPDVGAPGQGEMLPPPVKPHPGMGGGMGAGGGMFSSLPRSFQAFITEADDISLQDAARDVVAKFPTHRLASIDRYDGKFEGKDTNTIVAILNQRS